MSTIQATVKTEPLTFGHRFAQLQNKPQFVNLDSHVQRFPLVGTKGLWLCVA